MRLTHALAAAAATVLCAGTATGATAVAPAATAASATTATTSSEDGDLGRLMLLLDSSGSMAEPAGGGQTKIAAAKNALRTVVTALPDEAEVGLRVFGATVFSRDDAGACDDTQQVVAPATDNRAEIRGALGDYRPFGETPIPAALRAAAADLGDDGARSVVLVSDGESTCSPDPCTVAGDLSDQGIDLQIDVVGLSVSGAARDQLRCIADAGGGRYYDADDADDIRRDLTRASTRAIRPFVLTGEPIEGGPVDDPTPITVGDWTDTLGRPGTEAGSLDYVFTRTTAGSTLRASAITRGVPGPEGLLVEIYDDQDERCSSDLDLRQLSSQYVVGTQATASPENGCDQPGDYRIHVERRIADTGRAPIGLRISEEPPVTDPGYVPPAGTSPDSPEIVAPEVSGSAVPVVGGSGFTSAPTVDSGRYSSTVVPGEAVLLRVPLAFGQAARIKLTLDPGPDLGAQNVGGRFGPPASVKLYDPMQAEIDPPPGTESPGSVTASSDEVFLTTTPTVSRESISDSSADYSAAGDYYLGVSLGQEDYDVEFPFTVEVEVVGQAQSGPTYADDATWTIADGLDGTLAANQSGSPDDSASADPEPAADESAADDSESPLPAVGVGVGALGLVTLGSAALLWRRRHA